MTRLLQGRIAVAETLVGRLGDRATWSEAYGDVHVDVPREAWLEALTVARDALDLDFFDWLSAYDDQPRGLAVVAHVVGDQPGDRLLARTRVPADDPSLPSLTNLWPGAGWHERETHEMFGIDFIGHPDLSPLLLQPAFQGHPLRKDFVLASRAVREWPGAKDPSDGSDRPKRRRASPPGVPSEWAQP